jgi:hypothetical protein
VHHGTPLIPPLATQENHSKALKLHHLHKRNRINNIQHAIALVAKPVALVKWRLPF